MNPLGATSISASPSMPLLGEKDKLLQSKNSRDLILIAKKYLSSTQGKFKLS